MFHLCSRRTGGPVRRTNDYPEWAWRNVLLLQLIGPMHFEWVGLSVAPSAGSERRV
jgi:hypothetical protein